MTQAHHRTPQTEGWIAIEDEQQLLDLVGEPQPAVRDKTQPALTALDVDFLTASPLCFVGTSGPDGGDVSPKGDPPGFAHVIDDRTIALPERPGNKRMDGFRNILRDPRVALIFLIPGLSYTLRINGRASLVSDAPFFDDMIVKGNRPKLAMVVNIDEVFNHCPKAFLRSRCWQPDTWQPEQVIDYPSLAKSKWRSADSREEVERYYAPETYERSLYSSS